MALKGAETKAKVTEIILKTFPGSFIYEKDIRIPYKENGEDIQLKCSLTCAKVNVEPNGDITIPGAIETKNEAINFSDEPKPIAQVSQEEKDNVRKLMETFGL